jgi:hypothetical protein
MLDFRETDGLFENFEVNREPFWPQISWLIAGSGVWHVVLLACIILIPPVRNALNIVVLFSGGGFVDRPYNKTEIDQGDITEITLEKFHYPEGYFAMDQQSMPIEQLPPPVPFTPKVFSPAQIATPLPTPTPFPISTPSPAIAASSPGPSPAVKAEGNNDAEQKAAEKALDEASKKTGIDLPEEGEINKRPFKDLAAHATDLKNRGELDLAQPFEIEIETNLDKNGKLINQKVTKRSGDANLIDLGTRLVAAMNDSGVLYYLKKINEDKPGTKVVFTIKQDGKEVVATVTSEVSTPDSARQLASGFRVLMAAGANTRKGHDEEILLRSTNVTADGKNVVFKLTMAHKDVADIVKKGMAEPSPAASPS